MAVVVGRSGLRGPRGRRAAALADGADSDVERSALSPHKMVGFLHPSGQPLDLKLIILDKDGTLVDFCRTWLPGFKECAAKTAEAAGEPNLEPALLKAGGWVDEDPPRVTQEGLFLHAPLPEIAQAWIDTQPLVAQRFESASELTALMEEVLKPATVRDVTPLGPVEETLQALKSGLVVPRGLARREARAGRRARGD